MPKIIPFPKIHAIFLLFFIPHFLAQKGPPLDESILLEREANKEIDNFAENDGQRCWTNGNGQEAHWMGEGQFVERGKFWYKCTEGKLKPAGCLDEKGNRVGLNKTFTSNGYLLECQHLGGGLVRQKTIGCSPNGQSEYRVGEKWEEGKFWWECAWEGDRLKRRIGGCLVENGTRMEIGERMDLDKVVYECRQSAERAIKLVAVGCITNQGEHHWEGDFIFYCKKTIGQGEEGTKCEKTCIGCTLHGQNLFDGDRFQLNDSVLQCEVRPKRHVLKPVACISGGRVERVIDCKWNEQQSANGQRVQRQCILREGRALMETLGCVFTKDGINRFILPPGTFTIWKESMDGTGMGISCRQHSKGGELELKTFPEGEMAGDNILGLQMEMEPRM